ncbi:MAG: hypothetical protein HGA75_10280, partial [Thiobacillus sp.]|nr:hypothetical protein [Thiobacillus sp.]
MAVKVNRALLGALAVSLAAHLLLLGTAGNFGFTPEVTLEFPIEASLVAAESAHVAAPTPTSRRASPLPPPAVPAAVPEPAPPAAIEPEVATAGPAEPRPERLPE